MHFLHLQALWRDLTGCQESLFEKLRAIIKTLSLANKSGEIQFSFSFIKQSDASDSSHVFDLQLRLLSIKRCVSKCFCRTFPLRKIALALPATYFAAFAGVFHWYYHVTSETMYFSLSPHAFWDLKSKLEGFKAPNLHLGYEACLSGRRRINLDHLEIFNVLTLEAP